MSDLAALHPPGRAGRSGMSGSWCWRCDQVRGIDADLVRAAYEDPDVLASLMDEEALVHVPGRSWLAGDHRGRAAVLRLMEHLGEATVKRDITEILIGERHAAVTLRLHLSFGEGELTVDGAHLFRIQGSRIREGWLFHDRSAAMDEILGLPHRHSCRVIDSVPSPTEAG